MQDVKFGQILENACRLAGRNPSAMAIPGAGVVLAGMAMEAGLHAIAAEKFPLMQRVEFRRYRPDWTDGQHYSRKMEVWHGERYWRLEDASAQGEPGVADGWDPLEMSEVAAFIAFDQPWKNTVMQSFGVDTTRFAFATDPRYNPMTPPLECRLCELGVLVCPRGGTAPDGVWVKFIPEYPRIDFTEWSNTAAYAPGDAVYRTATKDVYQCIETPTVGIAPEADTSGKWRPLRIRGEFAAYLTRLAAADLLTEDQGKHQTRAAADREFELLCERYHEGNGETRVRRGRFC